MAARSLQAAEVVQLGMELQAILQAGVPLDLGLRGMSGTVSRNVSLVAQRLADRLDQGLSIADAIQAEPAVPQNLRIALVAGIRCGRSDEALADITEIARQLGIFQTILFRNLIYPGAVVLLTFVMLVQFSLIVLPLQLDFYESWRSETPLVLRFLSALHLPLIIPALFGLSLAMVLVIWGTGTWAPFTSMIGNLCGWKRVREDIAASRIAGLLGLLTKYDVPLPEALKMAEASADSPIWKTRMKVLSQTIVLGKGLSESELTGQGFPNFFAWLIDIGAHESSLPATLSQASEYYRRRAITQAEFLQRWIPILATSVIGGGFCLVYGVIVFETLLRVWQLLGKLS